MPDWTNWDAIDWDLPSERKRRERIMALLSKPPVFTPERSLYEQWGWLFWTILICAAFGLAGYVDTLN